MLAMELKIIYLAIKKFGITKYHRKTFHASPQHIESQIN